MYFGMVTEIMYEVGGMIIMNMNIAGMGQNPGLVGGGFVCCMQIWGICTYEI